MSRAPSGKRWQQSSPSSGSWCLNSAQELWRGTAATATAAAKCRPSRPQSASLTSPRFLAGPGTAANVELALSLGVDRIGHGWAMASEPSLMAAAVRQGTTVEVCLTSNVKPGASDGEFASRPLTASSSQQPASRSSSSSNYKQQAEN